MLVASGCAPEQATQANRGALPLAPASKVLAQGRQEEAGTLATARALLASPMASGEALDPQQRQPGGERVLWVRVEPPVLAPGSSWNLRLPEARLDRVTLYRLGSDGRLRAEHAGEEVPGSQWPLRTRVPTFHLGTPGSPQALVLRIENSSPFWLDLEAVDDIRFARDEAQGNLVLGAYFGVMAFAFLYSLLQFVFTRDRLYGWYALYLLVMAVRQDLSVGLSRSLWLPDAPQWWMALRHLSLLAAFPIGLLLVRALLPPQLVGLFLHRLGSVAIALSLMLALAYPMLAPEWSWQLYNLYGLATLVLLAMMLQRAWQPRLWQLHGFALGFAVIALAALVPLLVNLSVLPPSGWSAHALLVGGMLEALILSIALSLGKNDSIAVDLARSDRTARDPVTGFHGPALLPRLVHALLLRHRRAGGLGAVIALEIANAQDMTLHHGKDAFEPMLLVARRLIEEHARESDVALRLGRTRFALVMTRAAGPHQVLAVAQRIIDQGLRHSPELPASEHLLIHAAVAFLPDDVVARAAGLVQALHATLDQIRPGSGLVLRELEPAKA